MQFSFSLSTDVGRFLITFFFLRKIAFTENIRMQNFEFGFLSTMGIEIIRGDFSSFESVFVFLFLTLCPAHNSIRVDEEVFIATNVHKLFW